MMKARTSLWASLAIAASLGLAGCGGSSNEKEELSAADQCTADGGTYANDTCTTQADTQRANLVTKSGAVTTALGGLTGTDDDPTPTTDQIGAVNTAITALETSISGASALSNEAKRRYQDRVDSAKAEVGRAQAARTKADNDATKAATTALKKTGDALYKALVGTTGGNATNPLANITPVTLGSDELTVTVIAGAGALPNSAVPATPAVPLKPKSGSVDALSGWKGIDFTGTSNADESTETPKLTHEARVYHNQGAAKTMTFSGTEGKYGITAVGGYAGASGQTDTAFNFGDVTTFTAEGSKIKIPSFTEEGMQIRTKGENQQNFRVSGTFDGASGHYDCSSSTCSSTISGGKLTGLTGTWNFKPASGAMVSSPDADYLYFGWWVAKDGDTPEAASAFAGRVQSGNTDEPITDGLDVSPVGGGLSGTATFTGAAVGKYAYRDISEGTAHGGHFTADAELTAKFGAVDTTEANAGNGVTGTVDNFRLNDGTEDPGWKVSLNRAAWGTDSTAGQIAANGISDDQAADYAPANTTWSINGNGDGPSGTWSGMMYDEKPGPVGDDQPGDGNNLPTTVTGTFHSTFGSEGRMVGAFGATR